MRAPHSSLGSTTVARTGELDQRHQPGVGAEHRVFHVGDPAALSPEGPFGEELLVGGAVPHGQAADVGPCELGLPVVGGLLAERAGEELTERLIVRGARRLVGEPRIGREIDVGGQCGHEVVPLSRRGGGEEHPAVRRLVEAVARREPVEPGVGGEARRPVLVLDHVFDEHVRHGEQHRCLHRLSRCSPRPGQEPEQQRARYGERGEAVGVTDAHGSLRDAQRGRLHHVDVEIGTVRRRLSDVAHGQPRAGADGGRERRAVAARAVDAVAGRAQVHEAGVDREQRRGVEAETLDHAGAEGDEDRVGVAHQLVHDGASFVGVDVDRDALLALEHLRRARPRETG